MADRKLRVFPSPQALFEAAADHLIQIARQAAQDHGVFRLALSGGSTPRPLYEYLAQQTMADRLPWDRTEIYFTDERCVPPSHVDSNFRMACQALLDNVPIRYENLFRMKGELDPQQAADEYEQLLKKHLDNDRMDLVLLGMGEDGHTASLFPDSPALDEQSRLCVANPIASRNTTRLTLTWPFINQARHILILIAGQSKSARVQQVLEENAQPHTCPIQLINPADGQLTWMLDAAAAGMDQ